jgi:hypothetical protein
VQLSSWRRIFSRATGANGTTSQTMQTLSWKAVVQERAGTGLNGQRTGMNRRELGVEQSRTGTNGGTERAPMECGGCRR